MTTHNLYCHSCNKHYNVRQEDIALMQGYDHEFKEVEKGYHSGCFFKNLAKLKRSLNAQKDGERLNPSSHSPCDTL